MPRLCLLLLLLLIASSASAVSMAWTPIGNPGNPCDTQSQGCFGAVGYVYNIGTYEVTNAQYAEFLNAKAAFDPFELYHENMGGVQTIGGITRSGSSGSYTYAVIAGREQLPVNWTSFYDALRFANWMNNGQGSGDTETGAYTLLGGTPAPSNGSTVARNDGATIVLPSEDEWYKAAYYDPHAVGLSSHYYTFPAGSDTPTTCGDPTGGANEANCGGEHVSGDDFFAIGSYTGSPSPFGTFDQGGNVEEWIETPSSSGARFYRGGGVFDTVNALRRTTRDPSGPGIGDIHGGFRLATIPGGYVPEPSTGLLVLAGLLGIAVWRRVRD
jgi:formylglycine-generating enzyme